MFVTISILIIIVLNITQGTFYPKNHCCGDSGVQHISKEHYELEKTTPCLGVLCNNKNGFMTTWLLMLARFDINR